MLAPQRRNANPPSPAHRIERPPQVVVSGQFLNRVRDALRQVGGLVYNLAAIHNPDQPTGKRDRRLELLPYESKQPAGDNVGFARPRGKTQAGSDATRDELLKQSALPTVGFMACQQGKLL